jgi:hypothetical protein
MHGAIVKAVKAEALDAPTRVAEPLPVVARSPRGCC